MSNFNFNFTLHQVSEILKNNQQFEDWFQAFTVVLPEFDITTMNRVAAFLSQTCHESMNYTVLHENLNYRATSLMATWPSRFSSITAAQYEHKPEKIANKVYGGRMGNGPEESGDGWKYRGRGPIQITGKDNYLKCSNAIFGDDRLLENPELLEEDFEISVRSACWFWNSKNLNITADEENIHEMTRKINGGLNGLADRQSKFIIAMTILQDTNTHA